MFLPLKILELPTKRNKEIINKLVTKSLKNILKNKQKKIKIN